MSIVLCCIQFSNDITSAINHCSQYQLVYPRHVQTSRTFARPKITTVDGGEGRRVRCRVGKQKIGKKKFVEFQNKIKYFFGNLLKNILKVFGPVTKVLPTLCERKRNISITTYREQKKRRKKAVVVYLISFSFSKIVST